ncbi:MAG: single-stranded-DNA-specific exonuclease RecJ [Clostridiales bacterium]|nr:single-stranded-DNA-specific exonuclease RecJ [Clostridiales bacterium]
MKKWEIARVREENKAAILSLATELAIGTVSAAILYHRGYMGAEQARAFLCKETEAFYDPLLMKDMDLAVKTIEQAIEAGEKIAIYGDYDVDGVTSVCALYLYLQEKGAHVSFYIPHREKEGYGVNRQAIDALLDKGVSLVITVDTGITAIDEIAYANQKGMRFVVTDHHTCLETLPAAAAVINPKRPDCPYPFKELAGVGVVFKLLCALEMGIPGANAKDSAEAYTAACKRICKEYADLAAVGTIADVMPILDENRLLVWIGMYQIRKNPRVGLKALIELAAPGARIEQKVNSSFIGYTLAPRLNAAGRIGSAEKALSLLLATDDWQAAVLAKELCDTNAARQKQEAAILEGAMRTIAEEVDLSNAEALILSDNDWHQGVIGIVASRLTEKYSLPTILISFEGDIGKGSGRSTGRVNLVQALASCADLLQQYGGHAQAAGLTIDRANLPAFKERLQAYIREHKTAGYEEVLPIDCTLLPEEITVPTAEELSMLEPYGTGNPEPLFVLEDAVIAEIKAIGAGKHTKLIVEKAGIRCEGVFFNFRFGETNFCVGDRVDAVFHLSVNDFMKVKSAQMILRDLRLTGESAAYLAEGRKLYQEVQVGCTSAAQTDLVPNRADFALVYRIMKEDMQYSHMISVKKVAKKTNGLSYAKVRFIFDIFHEMKLIELEAVGTEGDVFKCHVNAMQAKVNLEKSLIYKNLQSGKECG